MKTKQLFIVNLNNKKKKYLDVQLYTLWLLILIKINKLNTVFHYTFSKILYKILHIPIYIIQLLRKIAHRTFDNFSISVRDKKLEFDILINYKFYSSI